MPLEFEENSPQIPSSTSAIPLPSSESKTEVERQFAAAWNKKQYAECRELLPQMPANITSGTLNLLLAIALRPLNWKERWLSTTIALRRECVYYLVKLPTPSRMMELKPLLFDNDSEIQDAVFDMFHRASKEALPMLLDGVIATLRNVSPNIPAHKRGMLETLQIFKEAKDKEAVAFLGEIVLGHLPTYPFNGRLEKGLKYGAIGVGMLIAGYLLTWLLYSPEAIWQAGVLYVVLIFIGSTLSAGLFYIGSFTLSLPYMIIRDNRVQALFQAEAIQALRRIGDKRALKPLMQSEYQPKGTSLLYTAILELLPLLEEEDTKWLGRTGRSWLTSNLRETSSSETLILLKATDILGNEAHIAPVLRMCKRSASPEVRAEAMRVLAVLESRRDSQQERRELLRASAMPDDYKETLLRPLQDHRDPQEEQELLHPAERTEE